MSHIRHKLTPEQMQRLQEARAAYFAQPGAMHQCQQLRKKTLARKRQRAQRVSQHP